MNLLENPVQLLLLTLVVLWCTAWTGSRLGLRRRRLGKEDTRRDFGVVLGASLTVLGLVIGFSFSMAIGRYELRKSYEEAEANAIRTTYLRADLLPEEDSIRLRALLREYTDLRIRYYLTRDHEEMRQIYAKTSEIHRQLWAMVTQSARSKPTPLTVLAVTSMNEVLNAEDFSREVWLDRIPGAAWGLLFGIALCCNLLVGYTARRADWKVFIVLPLVVAISFGFIADINSPHGGFVPVHPRNLERLQNNLKSQAN
jgi:hypothetical protein